MLSKRYSLGNILGIMDSQHTGGVGGWGGAKNVLQKRRKKPNFEGYI